MRRLTVIAMVGAALALVPVARAQDVSYDIQGTLGENGWYVSNVAFTWHVPAGLVPTPDSDCLPGDTTIPLTDTPGKQELCEIPGVVRVERTVRIDTQAPTNVAATMARLPDANDWYRAPVQVSWTGQDATSGIASCTTATYSGPDTASASTAGTCRDQAGNVSPVVSTSLRYDATAPSFEQVSARRGTRGITVRWTASPDTSTVSILRTPGDPGARTFSGAAGSFTDTTAAPGVAYTYVMTAIDTAGNTTSSNVQAASSNLLAPAPGARLTSPPLLRWPSAKHASYYNVQLFDGKRKILSAWPTRNRLQLKRTWRYAGVQRTLRAGHKITWYVWPGIGSRASRNYGKLVGQGRFTIG